MKRKKFAPLSTPRQRYWIVGGLTDELIRLVQKLYHNNKYISYKSLILNMTTQESQKGELSMFKQLPATAHNLYQYMKAQSNERNELDTTISLLSRGIDKGYDTTRKYLNILIEAGYITRTQYHRGYNKTHYIIERS